MKRLWSHARAWIGLRAVSCGAFALVLIIQLPVDAAKKFKKIPVTQPLTGRLMAILVEAEALHRVLTSSPTTTTANTKLKAQKRAPASKGIDPALNEQVKVLLAAVQKAGQFSKLAGSSRVHLEKILTAARLRLQDAQNVSKNKARKIGFLSESMRQIIQIAQMYDLDHKYKIFFCPKDRSVWLQSGNKAQHPFDLDGKLKSCGVVMR